jgi:hypothetical protein
LDDGRWAVDSTYADALRVDNLHPGLVIWDRSWASEAVYGRLLGRPRRLAEDPWLGEWLYGRGVSLKVILGGPHPEVSLLDRTPDDLPVHPRQEKEAFLQYARDWGWTILGSTEGERLPLQTLVTLVRLRIEEATRDERNLAVWCGPRSSPVVFVGERGSNWDSLPGGWLPFSSKYTTNYGRILGRTATLCGWTNAWDNQRPIFDEARLVVACGDVAQHWAEGVIAKSGPGRTRVEKVPHPAALYRWGRYHDLIGPIEVHIRGLVQQYLPLGEPSQEVKRATEGK